MILYDWYQGTKVYALMESFQGKNGHQAYEHHSYCYQSVLIQHYCFADMHMLTPIY